MQRRARTFESGLARACGGGRGEHAVEGEVIRVRACEGMRWRERRTYKGGQGHSSEDLRGMRWREG